MSLPPGYWVGEQAARVIFFLRKHGCTSMDIPSRASRLWGEMVEMQPGLFTRAYQHADNGLIRRVAITSKWPAFSTQLPD